MDDDLWNCICRYPAEKKRAAIAGLEAQLSSSVRCHKIRNQAQQRMFPGMSFKNVTPSTKVSKNAYL
jgi:hypothetical protein